MGVGSSSSLMGIGSSSSSTQIATAKLILHQDGRLQEYPYTIKVSYVLAKNPSCFICNSDDLDFDGVVSAVDDDEDLQPGQLYFALPLEMAEDMAALAGEREREEKEWSKLKL